MRRLLLSFVLAGAGVAHVAHAEPAPPTKNVERSTVALLPLTGDAHLMLYGQPVAREIARVLTADGFEVVVVGAGAPVPTRARLVIDGTIERASDGTIRLSARVRDPIAGEQVGRVQASAHELTAIDEAAQRLAAELSPALQRQLASVHVTPTHEPATPAAPVEARSSRPLAHIEIQTAAASDDAPAPMIDAAFYGALQRPLVALGYDATHETSPATGLDVSIDVTELSLELAEAPTAISTGHGRARVRVTRDGAVIFDRTVATDTIVGKLGAKPQTLVAAIAAQVAEIVRPQLRLARRS